MKKFLSFLLENDIFYCKSAIFCHEAPVAIWLRFGQTKCLLSEYLTQSVAARRHGVGGYAHKRVLFSVEFRSVGANKGWTQVDIINPLK